MLVGIVKESFPGERRVALTPQALRALPKDAIEVIVEPGAGDSAGFPDQAYVEQRARIASTRAEVFEAADIICQVRTLGANPREGEADLDLMRTEQIYIGHCEPLTEVGPIRRMAEKNVCTFAMELMPRITRAQSMDVLSSQATIAGYKAVILAATQLPKMFPMMMTAAGTIAPAKVFVVGAGVAGLQAIASAKRMGAVVTAYDIRSVVKEQIESLGAKFLEVELEAEGEGEGGYAKAMDEEFYRRQREAMAHAVAESDVVITTAAVPGKKSPVLVTAAMIDGMQPGSIVIDLAAERGGNCEPTKADETVVHAGVTIYGPTNLPATVPYHASQMYAKNLATFLKEILSEGKVEVDMDNEVIAGTLLTRDGEIVHPFAREVFGLEPLVAVAAENPSEGSDA